MFADHALRLFDNGYMPVPLRGKAPIPNSWQKGFSASRIEAFSAKFPDANVGVLTGSLLAVDIDCEERAVADQVA
ncbi:MAG: bifunctional DNA primase/polymerase, partial [Alphaproteobacteria bacterium]|nr:bifunctional DNA primase/polymerase [Alphaproteobacteria bacterium]